MNGYGRGGDRNKQEKTSILTKETVGMTLLLFSLVALFILATGPVVFGDIGLAISAFFYGVCGYFVYPLFLLAFVVSLTLISGKKFLPARVVVRTMLLLVSVFLIVHAATSERFFSGAGGYGAYLSGCWTAAEESAANATGGGVLMGIVAYPVRRLLTYAGSYVLYAVLTAASLVWFLFLTPLKKRFTARRARPQAKEEKKPVSFSDLPEASRPAPSREPSMPARAPSAYRQPAQGPAEPQHTYVRPAEPQPAYVRPAAQTSRFRDPYADPAPETFQAPAGYGTSPASAPSAPLSSREILFDRSPAENYRNNLIFDNTSAFNTRPRQSTVRPADPKTPSSAQTGAPSGSPSPRAQTGYAGSFSREAESGKSPLPRRVLPVERNYSRDAAADYPSPYSGYDAFPSYTPAPATDAEPPRIPETPPVSPAPPVPPAPATRLNDPAERNERDDAAEPNDSTRLNDPAAFGGPAPEFRRSSEEPFRFGERTGDVSRLRDPANPSEESDLSDPYGYPVRGESDPFTRESRAEEGSDRDLGSGTGFGRDLSDPYGYPVRGESDPFTRESRAEEDPAEEFPKEQEGGSRADLFDGDLPDEGDYRAAGDPFLRESRKESDPFLRESRAGRGLRNVSAEDRSANEPPMSEEPPLRSVPAPAPAPAPAPRKKHVPKKYRRPNVGLFEQYDDSSEVSQEEIGRNSGVILDTLKSFKIEAAIAKVTCGSTVTRYDIEIPKNVPVGMVIKRDTEIGMRLMVRDGVNMYVNNETGSVSIEVPNRKRATVGIRNVLSAPEYVNAKPGSLVFAMGKDIEGRNICGDIVKMKHLLVAGSTGSGKSVCLNTMLISLICKYSPEELRLILIDPKRVEFAVYDGIPHLMINEIITDPPKAISALNWALKEMERRYGLFEQKTKSGGVTIQNIDQYNESLTEDEEKLCKIVIVFDELADFMMKAKKDIEERISMITAKARAAGIHAVIATQRPSVDIITGVIKGNLPTRIAFRTIQANDSRIILDEMGAEKLLGMGDMLYRTEGMFNCLRVQGAFLSNKEIHDIIADIKEHNEAYYDEDVANYINQTGEGGAANPASFADDDDGGMAQEYLAALAVVVKRGQASISLIQRSCGVGYNHAGKIVEWMESMGYISPFDGAKARAVLLTKEEYEAKYGPLE